MDKFNLEKLGLDKLNLEKFKPDKAALERLNLESLKPSKVTLGKAAVGVANFLLPVFNDNYVPGKFSAKPSKPGTLSPKPAESSSASGRSVATAPVDRGRTRVGGGRLSASLLDKYLPELPQPLRIDRRNTVAFDDSPSGIDGVSIGASPEPKGGIMPEGTWFRGRHIEVTDSHAPSALSLAHRLPNRHAPVIRPFRRGREHPTSKLPTRLTGPDSKQGGYEYVTFTQEDPSDYTAGPARTVLAKDGLKDDCVALLLTPELSGLVKQSVNLARLLKRDEECEGVRRVGENGRMDDLKEIVAGCEKVLAGEGSGGIAEAEHDFSVASRKLERLEARRQKAHDKLWDRAEDVRIAEQRVLAVLEEAFVAAKLINGGKEPVPPTIGEGRVGGGLETIKEDQITPTDAQIRSDNPLEGVPEPKRWDVREAGPSNTQPRRRNGPEDALEFEPTSEEPAGPSNTQARHGKSRDEILEPEQPKSEWPAYWSAGRHLPTLLSKSFDPAWPLKEQPALSHEPARSALLPSSAHGAVETHGELPAPRPEPTRLHNPPAATTARANIPRPLFAFPKPGQSHSKESTPSSEPSRPSTPTSLPPTPQLHNHLSLQQTILDAHIALHTSRMNLVNYEETRKAERAAIAETWSRGWEIPDESPEDFDLRWIELYKAFARQCNECQVDLNRARERAERGGVRVGDGECWFVLKPSEK